MDQERIKELIEEGQQLLQTAESVDYTYLAQYQEVDKRKFGEWFSDVKLFLGKNKKSNLIAERKNNGLVTLDYNTCKEQLELLKDLLTEISEN